MLAKVNRSRLALSAVVNLVAFACLTSLFSYAYSIWLFNLPLYASYILGVCIFSAILYPFFLRMTRSDMGYLKGMLIFGLIPAVSLGYAEIVYYTKMEPIHHDFGESVGVLGLLWMILESVAICFYTIGYFGSRRLIKR